MWNDHSLKLRHWISTWLPLVSATLTFVNNITSNCSSTIPFGRLPWQEDLASRLVSPFKVFWWVWYSCESHAPTHEFMGYFILLTLTNLLLVLKPTCRWRHIHWLINIGRFSRATFVTGNNSEQVLLSLNNICDCVFLVLQTWHHLKLHKHKETDHCKFAKQFTEINGQSYVNVYTFTQVFLETSRFSTW